MTNGEVIESLFPNVGTIFSNIIDLNLWWKAEYKEPKTGHSEPFINKPCISQGVCHEDKVKVLDKIRAEIEQAVSRYSISRERGGMGQVEWSDRLIKESEVLQIIDKYKRVEFKVINAGNCMMCGKPIEVDESEPFPDLLFCKECSKKVKQRAESEDKNE